MQWPTAKARQVLSALKRIGWSEKRQRGSHRVLERPGWPDYVFAFHDGEEPGPRMLARVAKHTALRPEDLQVHWASLQLAGFLPAFLLPPLDLGLADPVAATTVADDVLEFAPGEQPAVCVSASAQQAPCLSRI